jgi:hypothetical protein
VTSYRRRTDLLVRRCPDRLLVLADGQVHTLNGPAVALFDALSAPADAGMIRDRVSPRFGEVPLEDIESGLKVLEQAGLAERSRS